MSSSWQWYKRDLDAYGAKLSELEYQPITQSQGLKRYPHAGFFTLEAIDLPLTPDRIESLLSSSAIGPPHGYDLLEPLPLPRFPSFPARPAQAIPTEKTFPVFGTVKPVARDGFDPAILDKERQLQQRTEDIRQKFQE